MKGLVTASICWTLALSPFVLAVMKLRGQDFLALTGIFYAFVTVLLVATGLYGVGITENLTTSLDGHIYLHIRGGSFQRGDTVAYRWHGGATYPPGTIFIKHVVGMPGDIVRVEGHQVWVNERYIGLAKTRSKAGIPLTPAVAGVIKPGRYFVATPNPDSLDSRYALSGNIEQDAIIGRAYALF